MVIKNKDIIKNNKKCIVCDDDCGAGKLTILGKCICNECVDKNYNYGYGQPRIL